MGKRRKFPITVTKINTAEKRELALEVIQHVYTEEKGWTPTCEDILPEDELLKASVSWFLAFEKDEPVGVLRVLYELPIELYKAYGFELTEKGMDVDAFLNNNKVAEIGRYAVTPKNRSNFMISMSLMREAVRDTLERGYTHYITDVFEKDPNSPLEFHQKILGFKKVATHETGELHIESRRITMLLDLKKCYLALAQKNNWIFRFMTQDNSVPLIDIAKTAQ